MPALLKRTRGAIERFAEAHSRMGQCDGDDPDGPDYDECRTECKRAERELKRAISDERRRVLTWGGRGRP